jgi:hypothetical protein
MLAWNSDFGFLRPMKDNTGPAKIDPRKERLAKALRDNLKRRKAQARDRAAGTGPAARGGTGPERKD